MGCSWCAHAVCILDDLYAIKALRAFSERLKTSRHRFIREDACRRGTPREAAARSPGEAAARFPMTEVDGEANTEMPKPMRVRFREDDAKELKREHCDVGEDVAAEKPKRRSATPRPRLRKSSAVGGNVWRKVVIMDLPSPLVISPTKTEKSELAAPPWALWRHVERREARSTRSASPRGRSASPRVRLRR